MGASLPAYSGILSGSPGGKCPARFSFSRKVGDYLQMARVTYLHFSQSHFREGYGLVSGVCLPL